MAVASGGGLPVIQGVIVLLPLWMQKWKEEYVLDTVGSPWLRENTFLGRVQRVKLPTHLSLGERFS